MAHNPFSLDPSVDVDQLSANLNNGVLSVTAPKDLKRIEAGVRKIPITTHELPAVKNTEELPKVTAQKEEADEEVINLDVKEEEPEGEKRMEALTS